MCDLTDAERQYLVKTRALTRDEEGRETLVGLTHAESDVVMAYRRGFLSGKRDRHSADLTIWLELVQKHELARPPLPLTLTETYPEIPQEPHCVNSRSAGESQSPAEVVDQAS